MDRSVHRKSGEAVIPVSEICMYRCAQYQRRAPPQPCNICQQHSASQAGDPPGAPIQLRGPQQMHGQGMIGQTKKQSRQEFQDNLLLRHFCTPADLPKHCNGCGKKLA
eukprot:3946960-Ditylum_brightwellii.AAC.1